MTHRRAALFLVILGLAQIGARIGGLDRVAGFFAATGASPAPKVFSAVQGLETFSTRFTLERPGKEDIALTPAVYARIEGPYNRRNVYGAVLAYGPVLVHNPATRPLWTAVARYALCGDAPLLKELGIEPGNEPVRIRLEPINDIAPLPVELTAPCEER